MNRYPSKRAECTASRAVRCIAMFGRLCGWLIGKQPVVLLLDHRIALASAFLQSPAV
jgi:hypothetical protein